MTVSELQELFSKHSDNEYLNFDRVQNKRSNRSDLHAFMLLDTLVPGNEDIICHAEHDEAWIGVDPEALAKVITEEQIIELTRCGVGYDENMEALHIFS